MSMSDWGKQRVYSTGSLIRFTGILLPVLHFLTGSWLAEKISSHQPIAVLVILSGVVGGVAGFTGGRLLIFGAIAGYVLTIVLFPQPPGEGQWWYVIYFLCLVTMLLIGAAGVLIGKDWRQSHE
jgi:hypothetical protein